MATNAFTDNPRTEAFHNADYALARIVQIYDESASAIRSAFETLGEGGRPGRIDAPYPSVAISARHRDLNVDARPSFGVLLEPGRYATTLTRPDLFADYYREQLSLVIQRHGLPVTVGESARQIPLPFVLESSVVDLDETGIRAGIRGIFNVMRHIGMLPKAKKPAKQKAIKAKGE